MVLLAIARSSGNDCDNAWYGHTSPQGASEGLHAPEGPRQDRGVVMAAVEQDGRALQHASAELQADRGVVLAAVAQTGSALQ